MKKLVFVVLTTSLLLINHHYKLKYSVRKGVAGTLYNLRGQADKEITCSGRWNP